MSSTSRSAQFTRLQKLLKKHSYLPVAADPNRPVMEHLLFGACLENAHYDVAEQAFAALVHNFFDWNEIRVTTVRELSEVMSGLPDPSGTGHRLKRILQSVFESTYSFDLEDLRKQNLGPAVERLKKIEGATEFSIAYVVQSALGGHAIPLDSGALEALELVGLISHEEVQAREVAGLERAIPKSKGVEFGSMLHQLGADFIANPYAPALHKLLLGINPDMADRLPKRRVKRQAEKGAAAQQKSQQPVAEAASVSRGDAAQPVPPEPAADAAAASASGRSRRQAGQKKKEEEPQPAAPAPVAPSTVEPAGASPAKKPAASKKKPDEPRKDADQPPPPPAETGKKKQPSVSGLSKKKPR